MCKSVRNELQFSRRFFLAAGASGLCACSAPSVWSSDLDVKRATFRSQGPRSLTLYTMRNVGSGHGAHSALLIDASQRVLFDPAGSFQHSKIPERNDVLFGINPNVEKYYVSYHARSSYYVIGQTVLVPHETAEIALQLALASGPTPQSLCTRRTSGLLTQLPGFEHISQTWFPNKLVKQFSQTQGVITKKFYEDDENDKSIAAKEQKDQIDKAISQNTHY